MRILRGECFLVSQVPLYVYAKTANSNLKMPQSSDFNLRILVYLVIYDSGWVSLENLLLSRHPCQSHPYFSS